MEPVYYLWSGVGPIENCDGDDLPMCRSRTEALAVLRRKRGDQHDWSLWERVGLKASLVGVLARDSVVVCGQEN